MSDIDAWAAAYRQLEADMSLLDKAWQAVHFKTLAELHRINAELNDYIADAAAAHLANQQAQDDTADPFR